MLHLMISFLTSYHDVIFSNISLTGICLQKVLLLSVDLFFLFLSKPAQ